MKGLGNRQRVKNPRRRERAPYAAQPAPGRQGRLDQLRKLNARGKPR